MVGFYYSREVVLRHVFFVLLMIAVVPLLYVLLWVAVSTALQLSNKALLGVFRFPGLGLLAVAQNVVTVLVCLSQWRSLSWPTASAAAAAGAGAAAASSSNPRLLRSVLLLGLVSGVSQLLGLAGAGFMGLAMFGVLRRTSLALALVAGLLAGERHTAQSVLGVAAMTLGAAVAAAHDGEYDWIGYAAVLLDNVMTVAQRQLIAKNPSELSWPALLLCQTFVALPISIAFALLVQPDSTRKAVAQLLNDEWHSQSTLCFAIAASLGVVLHLAVLASVSRVTPLSLAVAGATKNNLLAIAAILLAPKLPETLNLVGMMMSMAGNVLYIYSKMGK